MNKVKMIKKDAKISITLGTSFISDIQGLLLFILADKTEEDINALKEAIQSSEDGEIDFPEDWMRHVHMITSLLKEIEAIADRTNQVIEKDIEELLSTEEGSSPLPQSPEQPE
jgi:hypothetical protein